MEGDKVCFMYYEELRLKQFSYTAFCLGAKNRQLKFYVEDRWAPSPSYSLVPLKHTHVCHQDTSVVLSAWQLILVPFVWSHIYSLHYYQLKQLILIHWSKPEGNWLISEQLVAGLSHCYVFPLAFYDCQSVWSHPEGFLNIFCGTYSHFSQEYFDFPLVLGSWALVREDSIENGILPHLELKTLYQAYCRY